MARIFEYKSGNIQGVLSAAAALCASGSAGTIGFGPFWGVAAFFAGCALCFMVARWRVPVHGLRIEASQLVIAPRAKPYAIAFDDILGVHIKLDPEGDHCRIHMTGGERVSISPKDCPKGLTLKSELEFRGVLAALY